MKQNIKTEWPKTVRFFGPAETSCNVEPIKIICHTWIFVFVFFVLWHKLIKTDLSMWRHHFDSHRSVDKDVKASITDYWKEKTHRASMLRVFAPRGCVWPSSWYDISGVDYCGMLILYVVSLSNDKRWQAVSHIHCVTITTRLPVESLKVVQ